MKSFWESRLAPPLVFVACVAVWAPAFGADWINFDDPKMVWNNPGIADGLSLASARWAFTTWYWGMWHPLTWLSHALDISLFGLQPKGHHVVSVLLHSLTVALAFVWLRSVISAPRALFAALVFGLHPLRAESVVWIAERKDVLCTLFSVCALLAYGHYRRAPGVGRYLLVTACVASSLLSKPTAVTLPLVLLLLDWWPYASPRDWRSFGRRALEKVPWLLLGAGASALTVAYQQSINAVAAAPLHARLPRVAAAYALNLWHSVWPLELSYFYPRITPPFWFWGAGVAAVAALLASAWLWRTKQPGWTVGVLWFLGVTLPTAGIIAVGAQLTADRYTYFPQLGLLTAIASVLPAVPQRFRRAAWLGGAATVFACAALLWGQIVVWSNSELLFEHALHRDPDNARALHALGLIRLQQHRIDEATELLTKAASLNPEDGYALSNLARAHLAQGQTERALDEAGRATQLPADTLNRGLVLQLYGKLLSQAHRDAEAEPVLRAAVEAKPELPVELDYARVLIALERDDEALAAFQQCVARFPKDPRCYLEQAQLDLQRGRPVDVPGLLDAVERLAPGNPKVKELRERARPAQ